VLANRDAALDAYQRGAAALDAAARERGKWREQRQRESEWAASSGGVGGAGGQGGGGGGSISVAARTGVLGRLDELLHDPHKGSKVEARHREAEAELAVSVLCR